MKNNNDLYKDFFTKKEANILFLISIIICFYAVNKKSHLDLDYIEYFISILNDGKVFNMLFIIVPLLLNIRFYAYIDDNYLIRLRYKNYKEYYKFLSRSIIKMNNIYFLTVICILITILNFSFSNFEIEYYEFNNTLNIIYFIFILLKTYLLSKIIYKIFFISLTNFKSNLIVFLIASLFIININYPTLLYFNNYKTLNFGNYVASLQCNNFLHEILYNFIYIVSIYILIIFVEKFLKRRIKHGNYS